MGGSLKTLDCYNKVVEGFILHKKIDCGKLIL